MVCLISFEGVVSAISDCGSVRAKSAYVDEAYMAQIRVVILSSRTLFAEGIAQRLRQSPELLELHLVDAQQMDALERVVSAQPSTVLLDATDEETTRQCPLGQLFSALPSLTVVYLDPQQQRMQVVTSAQRSITAIKDLIEVIAGTDGPTST
jgi:hypothetical protein